jgi:hypothetical protein
VHAHDPGVAGEPPDWLVHSMEELASRVLDEN